MRWTWVVALLVVASTAGAAIQTDGSDCPVEIGESDEPGQELANVVGAQESVVAREIERRGFNATLANASDDEERAAIVATELERIEVRVATLETCRDALVDAREDGDLSGEEYRERAGTLEPEIVDARERLDRAADAADELSTALRADADIDEDRFEALTTRVADLESWVENPSRAIESASGEGETTVREPTTDEPTGADATEPRPPTTAPSTETPTAEPTPTTEPEPTTEPTTSSDGEDDASEETTESDSGSDRSDVNF